MVTTTVISLLVIIFVCLQFINGSPNDGILDSYMKDGKSYISFDAARLGAPIESELNMHCWMEGNPSGQNSTNIVVARGDADFQVKPGINRIELKVNSIDGTMFPNVPGVRNEWIHCDIYNKDGSKLNKDRSYLWVPIVNDYIAD
jgi:hypothetical protein